MFTSELHCFLFFLLVSLVFLSLFTGTYNFFYFLIFIELTYILISFLSLIFSTMYSLPLGEFISYMILVLAAVETIIVLLVTLIWLCDNDDVNWPTFGSFFSF